MWGEVPNNFQKPQMEITREDFPGNNYEAPRAMAQPLQAPTQTTAYAQPIASSLSPYGGQVQAPPPRPPGSNGHWAWVQDGAPPPMAVRSSTPPRAMASSAMLTTNYSAFRSPTPPRSMVSSSTVVRGPPAPPRPAPSVTSVVTGTRKVGTWEWEPLPSSPPVPVSRAVVPPPVSQTFVQGPPQVIEKPVYIDRIVEKPVYIEKIVEKPVYIDSRDMPGMPVERGGFDGEAKDHHHIIERPVYVEVNRSPFPGHNATIRDVEIIERPVYIETPVPVPFERPVPVPVPMDVMARSPKQVYNRAMGVPADDFPYHNPYPEIGCDFTGRRLEATNEPDPIKAFLEKFRPFGS